jgi:siroheme synthase
LDLRVVYFEIIVGVESKDAWVVILADIKLTVRSAELPVVFVEHSREWVDI